VENAGVENAGATKYGKPSKENTHKVPDEISANSWTSTVCQMSAVTRGLAIRRTKKRVNLTNDKRIKMCLQRFDSYMYMYAYTQFLFFYVQLAMPSAQRRC